MTSLQRFSRARPKLTLLLLALVYLALNALYPALNKPLPNTYYLGMAIDDLIPFSPAWVLPYVFWYFYLGGVPLLLMFRNQQRCAQAILSMILGLACSFLIFSVFQTTVPRPEVVGNDPFSAVVRWVYSIDEPYNAFPSIHVLASFILMLISARTAEINRLTRGALWLAGTAIIFATVFIKQHVVADIFGGMVLATGCCRLVAMIPLQKYLPVQGKQIQTAPKPS